MSSAAKGLVRGIAVVNGDSGAYTVAQSASYPRQIADSAYKYTKQGANFVYANAPSVKTLTPWVLIAIIISLIIIVNSMMVLEVLRQGNALADRAQALILSINPVVTKLNETIVEAGEVVDVAGNVIGQTGEIVDNVDEVVDNVDDIVGTASLAMYDLNSNVNHWGDIAQDNIGAVRSIPGQFNRAVRAPSTAGVRSTAASSAVTAKNATTSAAATGKRTVSNTAPSKASVVSSAPIPRRTTYY